MYIISCSTQVAGAAGDAIRAQSGQPNASAKPCNHFVRLRLLHRPAKIQKALLTPSDPSTYDSNNFTCLNMPMSSISLYFLK